MPRIEIAAEPIISLLGLSMTNTLLMSGVSTVFLGSLAIVVFRSPRLIPSGVQNAFEALMDMILGMMEGVFGTRERAEKFFPLVATIFFFVLASNWLGILPGIGSIGFYEATSEGEKFVPLFRSAASDINFTLALGIITVFAVNVFGVAAIGAIKHFSKFFSFFYKKKSTDPFSIRRLFLRILMVCVLSVGVLTLMFFLVFLGLMVLGYGFGPPS